MQTQTSKIPKPNKRQRVLTIILSNGKNVRVRRCVDVSKADIPAVARLSIEQMINILESVEIASEGLPEAGTGIPEPSDKPNQAKFVDF